MNKLKLAIIFCFVNLVQAKANYKDSIFLKNYIESCTNTFVKQILENETAIKKEQYNKLNYIIDVGKDFFGNYTNEPLYVLDASKPPLFEQLYTSNVDLDEVNIAIQKLNTINANTVNKSYLIVINHLDFIASKTINYQNFKDALFDNKKNIEYNAVSLQKELFSKIANGIINATIKILPTWNNSSLVFCVGKFAAIKKNKNNYTFTIGNSEGTHKIKSFIFNSFYPKLESLTDNDVRKNIQLLYANNSNSEQYRSGFITYIIRDEVNSIILSYTQLLKLNSLKNATTCDAIDIVLNNDFPIAGYKSLSLMERIRIIKIYANCNLGNNSFNHRENYINNLVQFTPKADQHVFLSKLITEKISNEVLLKILTRKIDNGTWPSSSNDFNFFISSLTEIIKDNVPKITVFDTLIARGTAIQFDPGFWTGDMMTYDMDDNGNITLVNANKKIAIKVKPYDLIGIEFKSSYSIDENKYNKGIRISVPAIFGYLLFNNSNTDNIKTGTKLVFDIVLFSTGIGELSAALEAKNAFAIARSLWNMGWAVSDILINGPIAEKFKDSKKAQKYIMWFNRIQLVAGGVGMASSYVGNGNKLASEYSAASNEIKAEINSNKLVSEIGEMPITNAEKNAILGEIEKNDDIVKSLNNSINLSEELFKDYKNISNHICHNKLTTHLTTAEIPELVNALKTAHPKVLEYLDDLDLDDFITIAQKYKANKTIFVNNLSDVNNFKNFVKAEIGIVAGAENFADNVLDVAKVGRKNWRTFQNRVFEQLKINYEGKKIGNQITLDITYTYIEGGIVKTAKKRIIPDNLIQIEVNGIKKYKVIDAKTSEANDLVTASDLTSTCTSNQKPIYKMIDGDATAGTITKVEMRGGQAALGFPEENFVNGKLQIQLESKVEFWVNTNPTDFTKYLIRPRIK